MVGGGLCHWVLDPPGALGSMMLFLIRWQCTAGNAASLLRMALYSVASRNLGVISRTKSQENSLAARLDIIELLNKRQQSLTSRLLDR